MNKITRWVLRIVPALILFQTLYYKFGGHEESIALFSQLGIEPWGRIGTGIVELFAGILLLIPKFTRFGALLSLGTMLGAIASHLFVIGINYNDDGGTLFGLAVIVTVCCLILLFLERDLLKSDVAKLLKKK